MRLEWRRQYATVYVDTDDRYARVSFFDGAVCEARPHDTPAYDAFAATLGYAGPAWPDPGGAMSREHEVCHHFLAEVRGLPWSPALWAVAHGYELGADPLHQAIQEEEWLVTAFQALLNGLDPAPCLGWWLVNLGHDLDALRAQARVLLRREAR